MTDAHYNYLMDLRDSGVTNMSGAASYLQEVFGLSRQEARAILIADDIKEHFGVDYELT